MLRSSSTRAMVCFIRVSSVRGIGHQHYGATGVERERNMANAETVWAARRLLRGARQGVLATASDGQPHAALVTPATAPDLSPLLFLSGLSAHTRQLRVEPRCALLVAGEAIETNPQTAPRLAVQAEARPEPDAALRARWLALHPYAGLYAGLRGFHAVAAGGERRALGRRVRARGAHLAARPDAGCRGGRGRRGGGGGHHGALQHRPWPRDGGDRRRGGGAHGRGRCRWLRPRGGRACRAVAWREPVADAAGVRAELVRLAREPARMRATRAGS